MLQYFGLIIVALTFIGGVVAFTFKKSRLPQGHRRAARIPDRREADAPAMTSA